MSTSVTSSPAARASAALFLSDVAHVRGEDGEPLDALGPAHAEALRSSGTIAGGMIPKAAAALSAASGLGPGATVRMGRGDEPNAVLALLAGACGIAAASYGNQVLGQMPTSPFIYVSVAACYLAPYFDQEIEDSAEANQAA